MTPIQKAIAEIDERIEYFKSIESHTNRYDVGIEALSSLKNWLSKQLQHERECIERAYEQGEIDCHDTECGSQAKHNNAIHCFTKTYGHDS